MNGILLINKEKEYTSQDVVSCVKKILNQSKAGHTGTLDPLATGVLPVLLGTATKLSKYLIEHDKIYEAVIKLGKKTTTGDLEGNIIEERNVNNQNLEKNNIETILDTFLGESYQIPPMYSAIKVKGKKLYEYARDGIEIERKKRKINIYDIELINIDFENYEIKIRVKCSKGTYIRTLCEDIAEKLDTVGLMKELIRIQVDEFKIEDAISLEELQDIKNKEEKMITIEEYYTKYNNLKIININEENKLKLFLNGNSIKIGENDGVYKIYSKDRFLGIGIVEKNRLKRDVII